MRVCVLYDFFYPLTVGGAERWYRNLADRLAAAGHDVTYLTLRHWEGDRTAELPFRVVAFGPRLRAYDERRRRILPALVFGARVFSHLVLHGRRYDVVHSASFPYFSVLAAGVLRRFGGYRIVVDWHEVWTRQYWREYAGAAAGTAGWLVQRLCARIGDRAFCFSRLHAERLRTLGFRREISVLQGEYAGDPAPAPEGDREPLIVFAGRHIPEKQPGALIRAFALVRDRVPGVRCEIYGDGPERGELVRLVGELALDGSVSLPGIVDADVLASAFRRAQVHVLPSRREGYGLVVVEAAAAGTPTVVVRGPDNAATELVEDGVNGFVAPSADPDDLAAAIAAALEGGERLRASTRQWYARNAERLSLDTSLTTVLEAYERD
ncbi:MAG: glycosyltransferase [Actinomycetota bacterium]|nr:glycosyltransferase [Actinomycetota bacterium]